MIGIILFIYALTKQYLLQNNLQAIIIHWQFAHKTINSLNPVYCGEFKQEVFVERKLAEKQALPKGKTIDLLIIVLRQTEITLQNAVV